MKGTAPAGFSAIMLRARSFIGLFFNRPCAYHAIYSRAKKFGPRKAKSVPCLIVAVKGKMIKAQSQVKSSVWSIMSGVLLPRDHGPGSEWYCYWWAFSIKHRKLWNWIEPIRDLVLWFLLIGVLYSIGSHFDIFAHHCCK